MKLWIVTLLSVALLAVLVTAMEEEEKSGWTVGTKVPADQKIKFEVALKQNEEGVQRLEALVMELSSPDSDKYRQWLTTEEVMAYTAPPLSVQQEVVQWLRSTGLSVRSFGDFVTCEGSVKQISALFKVDLYHIHHALLNGVPHIRAVEDLIMPARIRSLIDFVSGLTLDVLPVPKQVQIAPRTAETAAPAPTLPVNYAVVPMTIRQLYNFPSSMTIKSAKSSLGIVEFGQGSGISFPNLQRYLRDTNSAPNNLTSIVGPWLWSPANPVDGEATLDVQLAASLTPGLKNFVYWTVPGWLFEFTSLIQQRQSQGLYVPWIFSFSYGWAESQQCSLAPGASPLCESQNQSAVYVQRQNTEFMKVGATGITLVGLSQDAGAASKWNMKCTKTPSVNPSYPGVSPWITTLGATQVLNGSPLTSSSAGSVCGTLTCLDGTSGVEVACSVQTGALITTGGGFSIYTQQPPYQTKAVNGWLQSSALRPPAHLFNPANRASPDISAIGHAIALAMGVSWESVDGTSASAPLFAAILTNLQDAVFSAGQPPLGFFNPLLYSMWSSAPPSTSTSSLIRDITIGNNTATEYPNTCTTPGYGTTVGYDPVCGLGVPNVLAMLNYVQKNVINEAL